MNHKQEHTLQQIFRHPINSNLKWPEVHSLFHALGNVTLETEHRFKVEIDDHHQVFHPRHHSDLSADDVIKIRHFLGETGHAPPANERNHSIASAEGSTQDEDFGQGKDLTDSDSSLVSQSQVLGD